MTLKQAIKDPSWLLERMSNQKVEGNDGPGFRHVCCPRMLWEELVRLVEGLKVEEGRWVIVAEGEGAAARVLDADADLHAAIHEFMCVCGKPWEQCDSLAPEELRFIDDPDEWAFDEDGERFSCSMRHETGSITLYQLECAAQHLKREQGSVRCNRCQANLCEHDNCTDWTCARACSKCAKGPREQEPAPRELRKTIIEELYKRHNGLSPQWIDDFAAFVVRAAAQPPQELVSLREEFKAKADRAYCDYVDQLNRESCLGYEAKLRARKFGHQELDAHKRAAELYGKHLAFTEARAALTRGEVG